MNCQFFNKQDLAEWGEEPDWEYSEMVCDDPAIFELIENETTEAEFYLDKSFSYGDFFVMFILTIFVLFGIVKIIWNNFVKK